MPPLPRGHKHPDELRERAVRMELGHAHEPVALDGDLLNPELKRAPATGRRVEAHQQKAVNGLNAHFGDETTEHVETLEGLIAGLGGDPGYISPRPAPPRRPASAFSSRPSSWPARSTS
jgi:hypothetical protein